MPIFCVKSVKIYIGQKKFTWVYPWRPWQISGMGLVNKWPLFINLPHNHHRRHRTIFFVLGRKKEKIICEIYQSRYYLIVIKPSRVVTWNVKYPLRPLTMQQIVQLIVWKCQIVTLRSVVDKSIITRFSKVSDNYEANMKLIQARRCVWSICNNAACGDEWFKAHRTQEDIVCLSLSAKPVSMSFHRPEIWFLDLWHLITWALLISKFMNVEIKGRPARLICFISESWTFALGNALFLWTHAALRPSRDLESSSSFHLGQWSCQSISMKRISFLTFCGVAR